MTVCQMHGKHMPDINWNIELFKVEYHANENPSTNSEQNCLCWSKVNASNNRRKIILYHATSF